MAGPYGPEQTGAVQDLEFYAAAGTLTLPLYRGGDATTRRKDVAVSGTYESGDSRATRDVAQRVHTLDRGAGYSRRPFGLDESSDWNAYAEGENVCTRFGYVIPSGEQTVVSADLAWGQPVKMLTFGGDVWVVFQNRLAYIENGTASSLTDYYAPVGSDQFTDAEIWGGSLRVAQLCTHSNPDQHFFVTVTPSGGGYAAALNPTPASPAGTGATAATPALRLMATVFWEYQGTGNLRLAGQVTDTQFRYMVVPSGDPYDQANWSAAVTVGDPSSTFEIRQLVSSHDTLWAVKQDGVYAITDKNAAAGGENLTPYWKDNIDADATSAVGHYWGQYLIVARPLGMEAIDVNSWTVQDAPRQIDISHGRPNDTGVNGRYTALGSDRGYLLAAQVGPTGARLMYGVPRRRESPTAGVTEFDWFGPEVGPISGREILALCVHTPESTLQPALWVGVYGGGGTTNITRVSLFRGSSPLADPNHRYNTASSLTYTDEHWGARSATKGGLRGTLAVRNCGDGRSVSLYAVAGAGSDFPGSPQVTVSTDVETQSFNLTDVRGSTIRTKIALTSTATTPVVVDERELKANLAFPLRSRGVWLVEASDVRAGDDLPSGDDPLAIEEALVALCSSAESFSALCDDGETRTILLDNILPWRRDERSDAEPKVRVLEVRYQVIA